MALAGLSIGQIKKQFTVEDSPSCEDIKLCLKANSGNCYIKPSQNPEVLNVFSNQTETDYSHTFRKEIKGKTCEITLDLEEVQSGSLSRSISTSFFGSSESESASKIWKMYLTDDKPYFLELQYGMGNANVDLSGLSIKKLKINSYKSFLLHFRVPVFIKRI